MSVKPAPLVPLARWDRDTGRRDPAPPTRAKRSIFVRASHATQIRHLAPGRCPRLAADTDVTVPAFKFDSDTLRFRHKLATAARPGGTPARAELSSPKALNVAAAFRRRRPAPAARRGKGRRRRKLSIFGQKGGLECPRFPAAGRRMGLSTSKPNPTP